MVRAGQARARSVTRWRIGWVGAVVLFTIFVSAIVAQVIFEEITPNHDAGLFARYAFGVGFLVMAVGMMLYDRRHLTGLRDRSVEFYEAIRERAGVA